MATLPGASTDSVAIPRRPVCGPESAESGAQRDRAATPARTPGPLGKPALRRWRGLACGRLGRALLTPGRRADGGRAPHGWPSAAVASPHRRATVPWQGASGGGSGTGRGAELPVPEAGAARGPDRALRPLPPAGTGW